MESPRRRLPDLLRKADKLLLLGLMTISLCAACLSAPEPVVAVPTMITPNIIPNPTQILDVEQVMESSSPDLAEACLGVDESQYMIRVTQIGKTENSLQLVICGGPASRGWNVVARHYEGPSYSLVEDVSEPIDDRGIAILHVYGPTELNEFQLYLRTDTGINLADPSRFNLACPMPNNTTLSTNSVGDLTYTSRCEETKPGESGYEFDWQMIQSFMGNDYLYLSRSDFLSLFASNFLV